MRAPTSSTTEACTERASEATRSSEKIAARENEFDCVAIIRGGGAVSELAAFDNYDRCCLRAPTSSTTEACTERASEATRSSAEASEATRNSAAAVGVFTRLAAT